MLHRLDRIEELRDALLREIAALPAESVARRPAPDRWSILEIVEHLLSSEQSVLAGMDDASTLRPRRRSLRSRVGYGVVIAVLALPVRVAVPVAAMAPRGGVSLATLSHAWREHHRVLRRHIEAVLAGRVTGAVFTHPVAGPLTTGQALRMLDVHVKRHAQQIRAIIRSMPADAVDRAGS